MAESKTILILGASYAGLSSAHYILKHVLPSLPLDHKIALVAPSNEVFCRPACPRALVSDSLLPQEKLFADIPSLLAGKERIVFEQGLAISLNHRERKVRVQAGTVEKDICYHALIIATGASTESPLLGLNEGTSERLRTSWGSFREALPTAKRIVIGGGGPAGIEVAGELGEYLNGYLGWKGGKLKDPRVSITVVTAGTQILPALRESIARKAEGYLARLGISILKGVRIEAVDPVNSGNEGKLLTGKTCVRFSNGESIEADIYIPAMGTKPNTRFVDDELLLDGLVETDQHLRVEKAGPRVYAIGDASSYARPAVHAILSAVPVLCANIKRDLLLEAGQNAGEDRVFREDLRETQLVPIGRNKGVGAAMGWQLPSFLVWLIKGRDYWLWTTGKLWSGKQWAKGA
ncbi:hypothetical protein N7532_009052 [Penicillium argentinense]|uniref:FAD/NAD(P)-binding domain-containing protein n=1 Tax=Penicillium argentinense TaxID=1131581 RepID=A0A9W9EYL2_9EURO|nr:uncharacterized protein N7532_009052 [Penicillium argentinense]KAJ5090368.1 hypothetical protein N7532_009052 [Penicillium argentinense]